MARGTLRFFRFAIGAVEANRGLVGAVRKDRRARSRGDAMCEVAAELPETLRVESSELHACSDWVGILGGMVEGVEDGFARMGGERCRWCNGQ